MAALKKIYLVKKKNDLNEVMAKKMELQELRLLAIYLCKINKDNELTRRVRFSLDDFQTIMGFGRLNVKQIKKTTDALLSRVVSAPVEDENGKYLGYESFHIFKICKVVVDDPAGNYIEFDAHDYALPLMFDFKSKFFTYQLSSVLQVKSHNQLRMYEILKQYEKIGFRIMSIEELKRQIGIDQSKYNSYGDFKKRVLNACQQALQKNTDIAFTYEPYGKHGKGGKILYLKFLIKKNHEHTNQLSLSDFIEKNKQFVDNTDPNDTEISPFDRRILLLSDACDNEFSTLELKVLNDKIIELLPHDIVNNELECFNYLMRKYRYMNMQNEKKKIKYRFRYIASIIGSDLF